MKMSKKWIKNKMDNNLKKNKINNNKFKVNSTKNKVKDKKMNKNLMMNKNQSQVTKVKDNNKDSLRMGDYFYNLNITKFYVKIRPEKIRLYSRTFLSTSA